MSVPGGQSTVRSIAHHASYSVVRVPSRVDVRVTADSPGPLVCSIAAGRKYQQSAKRSCAGVKFSGLQTACCILGITDAACSRAAAVPPSPNRRRIPSPDADSCQTRFRGLLSELRRWLGFRTGSWPSPPAQARACLHWQACVVWVADFRVWNSSRRIYFELLFNYPLQVCVISEESPYKPDPVLLRGITIHLDL